MAAAAKHPTAENYHEWRKRVKDHWYHVRLLESLWTDVLQAHEASLRNLETWLGDDHNLSVLCDHIEQNAARLGEAADVDLFLTLSRRYQEELRENSLTLGEQVYAEKPRHLNHTFSKLWDAWQAPRKQVESPQAAKAKRAAAA